MFWTGTRASAQCAASDAHREVLYAYLHSFLARVTVEKACADSALCVPLILPVAILAPGPNWKKQIAASVLTQLPRTATVSSGSAIPERSSDALERLDQCAVGSRRLRLRPRQSFSLRQLTPAHCVPKGRHSAPAPLVQGHWRPAGPAPPARGVAGPARAARPAVDRGGGRPAVLTSLNSVL